MDFGFVFYVILKNNTEVFLLQNMKNNEENQRKKTPPEIQNELAYLLE